VETRTSRNRAFRAIIVGLVGLSVATAPAISTAAAKLRWKPYRAVTTEERAVEAAKLKSHQVIQAAAQFPADTAAEPFGDRPTKSLQLTPATEELPSNSSGIADDPLQDATGQKPGNNDEPPDGLEAVEDQFPDTPTPRSNTRSRNEDLTLPPEEPVPSDTQSSPSDELFNPNSPLRNEPMGCASEKSDCADAFARLKANTLANIELSIAITGAEGTDFPCECPFGAGETYVPRNWTCITYNWKASGLCHKPLYFEQVGVERYGHSMTPLLQDVMCGVHFFATLPCLPYLIGMCPPHECQYSLGYYRPGNCAPYLVDPLPLSARGGLLEATAIIGGILIIP
jgi:hypothetical protein